MARSAKYVASAEGRVVLRKTSKPPRLFLRFSDFLCKAPRIAIYVSNLVKALVSSERLASADEAGDGDNQFGRHYGLGYVHLKTRAENP